MFVFFHYVFFDENLLRSLNHLLCQLAEVFKVFRILLSLQIHHSWLISFINFRIAWILIKHLRFRHGIDHTFGALLKVWWQTGSSFICLIRFMIQSEILLVNENRLISFILLGCVVRAIYKQTDCPFLNFISLYLLNPLR